MYALSSNITRKRRSLRIGCRSSGRQKLFGCAADWFWAKKGRPNHKYCLLYGKPDDLKNKENKTKKKDCNFK